MATGKFWIVVVIAMKINFFAVSILVVYKIAKRFELENCQTF